jgi:MFS family permease
LHALTGFAGSFVGIFVPIYLLNLGYSLQVVLFCLLLQQALGFVFFIAAGFWAERFDLRALVVASYLLVFPYLGGLHLLEAGTVPLWVVIVVNALRLSLYWFPLHVFFAQHAEDAKMGDNVSKLQAFPKALRIASPLVGGIIASVFGFQALFALSAMLYIFCLWPLLSLPAIRTAIALRLGRFFELARNNVRYMAAEFAQIIREEAEGVIWPIVVFLSVRNTVSVGAVGTLAAVGGILFTLLVGRYTDTVDKKLLMKIGGGGAALVWLGRYFFHEEIAIYSLTAAAGFFETLLVVPFTATIFSLARAQGTTEFIAFREIPILAARTVLYSFAIVVVANIDTVLLLPALSSVFFLFY